MTVLIVKDITEWVIAELQAGMISGMIMDLLILTILGVHLFNARRRVKTIRGLVASTTSGVDNISRANAMMNEAMARFIREQESITLKQNKSLETHLEEITQMLSRMEQMMWEKPK